MSIQPVSNNCSLWQTMLNDFQTLNQDLTAVQTAQKSGNQDQIQISQDALQKAMASFQTDISSLQKGQRHHHHHHGGGDASSATGAIYGNSSASAQTANPLQILNQDITALQNALQSGNRDQIQSSQNALQTVMNDLSSLTKTPYSQTGQQQPTSVNSVNLQG